MAAVQKNLAQKGSTISFDLSRNSNEAEGLDLENQRTGQPKEASLEELKDASEAPTSHALYGRTSEVDSQLPPPTSISFNYKATKAPKETLQAVYKTGEYKAALPLNLLMIQSFMAGIYIAMAGHLYLAVGGGVLGAALFPTGLIAVILTSAELFTGDALVFVASVLGGRVSFAKLVRNWSVSWLMNFAGCLFWASTLAYASDSLKDLGQVDLAIKVALKKGTSPWMHILIKAIGANFMVCVGVWQATCAEEVAGKILALWFPISAFVMLGFDHCIANQFLIPVGMMLGADISISDLLFKALLPATIGNIIGGGVLVGGVYWYVYDSMASSKQLLVGIREGLLSKTRRLSMANLGRSRRMMATTDSSDDGKPLERTE
jgi:formate/nitrite transporter